METRIVRVGAGIILALIGILLFSITVEGAPLRSLVIKLVGLALIVLALRVSLKGMIPKRAVDEVPSKAVIKRQLILLSATGVLLVTISVWLYIFSMDYIFFGSLKAAFQGPIIALFILLATFIYQWRTKTLPNTTFPYIILSLVAIGIAIYAYLSAPEFTYNEASELVEETYNTTLVQTEIKSLYDMDTFDYPKYYFRTASSDVTILVDPKTGIIEER